MLPGFLNEVVNIQILINGNFISFLQIFFG